MTIESRSLRNQPAERWRQGLPVLVPEAQTLGALAVIRSLGRGGYPVHACSAQPDALGLHSNYCTSRTICPPYSQPHFLDWLRGHIHRHGIQVIVPSEGFLHAIRPAFAEFSSLLPCPPPEILFGGMSKANVFTQLMQGSDDVRANLPPSLCLDETTAAPTMAELESLGLPVFLKVDAGHARTFGPAKVIRADSPADALARLAELRRDFRRVLIQGFVPGCGVGAFVLMWNGAILAEFQHRRLHEVPHTGGVSSFRESFFHPGIQADARAKLRHLQWQGVGMMEYRWDRATGRFHLLEFNGRFWGSLHLALHAGVDFPTLLLDAFHGRPQPLPHDSRRVRCRNTIPMELQYVMSKERDGRLGLAERLWPMLEFFVLSLDPTIYDDLCFPGDRGVWRHGLRQWWQVMRGTLLRRLAKKIGLHGWTV